MMVILAAFCIVLVLLLQKLADYCDCKCKIHKIVLTKVKRKLMFSTLIRGAQLGYMFEVVTALKGILEKKYELDTFTEND